MMTLYSRQFLKWFAPLAAGIAVAALLLVDYQTRVLRKEIIVKTTSALSMEKEVIESRLSTYLSDALFLSQIVELHLREHRDSAAFQDELADEFLSFSNARKVYDQIRFLDETGMEIVRINITPNGAVSVPEEKLQNKGSRYYFKEGLLPRGQIYISRFDLNKERGEVERPLKPMLRFSTPVYDATNTIRGVIVINYLGVHILNHLRSAATDLDASLYMTNPEGYWLLGPNPADEWGFMFPDGNQKTMVAQMPEAWKRISASVRGQVDGPRGLTVFQTVSLIDADRGDESYGFQGKAEELWKIVSFVPSEQLLPAWRWAIYGSALVAVILTGIVALMLVKSRVREKDMIAALGENEEKFRTVTNSVRDAIIMIDSDDRVAFWSNGASDMFGYGAEEVMGQKLHDFVVPDEIKAKAEEGLARFKSSGEGIVFDGRVEVQARRKDGSQFAAEVSASLVEIEGKRYAAGSARDISERKRAEEAVGRLNEELEERVKSRTDELEAAMEELRSNVEQLERFSELAHGREMRMIRLKEEVNALLTAKGDKEKYKIVS